jgi:hypothetical protein
VFSEIITEASLPKDEIIGAAPEVLYPAGGDSGDWITFALHIPAAEAEIGRRDDFLEGFKPNNVKALEKTVKQNHKWIEYTMQKMGNHISIQSLGYTKVSLPTDQVLSQ